MKAIVSTASFGMGAAFLLYSINGVGINSAPGVAATGLAFVMVGCTMLLRGEK